MSGTIILEGVAARFGTLSTRLPASESRCSGNRPFREVLLPSCFDVALQSGKPITFDVGHDEAATFASTADGALALWTDEFALRFRIRVPEDHAVADAVERGRCRGVSISGWPSGTRNGDVIAVSTVELVSIALCIHPERPAHNGTFCRVHYPFIRERKSQ